MVAVATRQLTGGFSFGMTPRAAVRRLTDCATGFNDDHSHLDNMLQILQNLGLVQDITCNNVKGFMITGGLAEYLGRYDAA